MTYAGYWELVRKARAQAKNRQGGLVNPLCDTIERLSDVVDELRKTVEAQEKRALRAEARIIELTNCRLCGRPFANDKPHINCADTGAGGITGTTYQISP